MPAVPVTFDIIDVTGNTRSCVNDRSYGFNLRCFQFKAGQIFQALQVPGVAGSDDNGRYAFLLKDIAGRNFCNVHIVRLCNCLQSLQQLLKDIKPADFFDDQLVFHQGPVF